MGRRTIGYILNRSIAISILLLLIMGWGGALEYRTPVSILSTLNPAVLMPGDEAVMAIELQNNEEASESGRTAVEGRVPAPAAGAGAGRVAGQGAGAGAGPGRDAGGPGMSATATVSPTTRPQTSVPIDETRFIGSDAIRILSSDYKSVGMMGPGDKVILYYKIKAEENISAGTYLLDFSVLGNYGMSDIKRQIPVKVDRAAISLARADASTASINLNVANPRENSLNAVTIIPSAPSDSGIRFSPEEYYIGSMDPDEVFTISFSLDSKTGKRSIEYPVNLSFISRFKNGDNWHTSPAMVTEYYLLQEKSSENSYLLPAGIAILILLAAGICLYLYLYRFKRRAWASGNH